jgi:CP family cyanate transporter-like MFS transporter
MRAAVTSVGPIGLAIQEETGLSNAGLGLVTALPLIAFGLLSLIAPAMGRRLGFERAMLVSLCVLVAGILTRSSGPVPLLLVGSFLIGAGIAVLNVLVPALIRRDFQHNLGALTGVYSALLGLTAGVSASLSVPLMNFFGGSWRWALVGWAVPAVIAGFVWAPHALRNITRSPSVLPHAGSISVWRSKLAWSVTLFMGLQSLLFYTLAAWLPILLHERGMSKLNAGNMMLLFQLVSISTSLLAPYIAQKMKDQVPIATWIGGICVVGSLGLLIPTNHFAWLWVSILGLGTGGCLSLALTMIGLRSKTVHTASELSGMAQAIGYLIAALGPVVFGKVHDVTGAWWPPLVLLALTMCAMTWFARIAGQSRHVDEH